MLDSRFETALSNQALNRKHFALLPRTVSVSFTLAGGVQWMAIPLGFVAARDRLRFDIGEAIRCLPTSSPTSWSS